MMKFFSYLILLFLGVLWACGSSPEASAEVEVETSPIEASPVEVVEEESGSGVYEVEEIALPEPESAPSSPPKRRESTLKGKGVITWKTLEDVEFSEKYYEEVDGYFWAPTFGESLYALEGKRLKISGYVIPIDEGVYVLSANTFSACFFCGQAGPETILELQLKPGHKRYMTDEWVSFEGTFRLNADDIDHLNYIFEGAVEIDELVRSLE
ncbi:MAG: hypothetical protein AAFR66_12270 [Bacteroidota bacterium]